MLGTTRSIRVAEARSCALLAKARIAKMVGIPHKWAVQACLLHQISRAMSVMHLAISALASE